MILGAGLTRGVRLVLAVLLLCALPACSSATSVEDELPSAHLIGSAEFLPGVSADVYLPDRANPAGTLVLVPGGAWQTADRSGLAPLAEALASAGYAVVNATYRAAEAGVVFPVPAQDVRCAVAFAAHRVASAGHAPGALVVIGHSSGAHLAALAALSPDAPEPACTYPQTRVDGLVGLAGPYDISAMGDIATPLFGVGMNDARDVWRRGNPLTWAEERPGLPVLLVHGESDELVPVTFTQQFASALRAGGHPVRIDVVPRAGHADVYRAGVAAPLIVSWMHSAFPTTATPAPPG